MKRIIFISLMFALGMPSAHAIDNMNACNKDTYTVTYSCGDGTGTPPSPMTATYGAALTLPLPVDVQIIPGVPLMTCVAPANKVFAGWRVGDTGAVVAGGFNFDDPGQLNTITWLWKSDMTLRAEYVAMANVSDLDPGASLIGLSGTMSFANNEINIAFPFGGVSFTAACSSIKFESVGDADGAEAYVPPVKVQSLIHDETSTVPEMGGQCYCKMTAPVESYWVTTINKGCDADNTPCLVNCMDKLLNPYSNHRYMVSMFTNTVPQNQK